MNSSKKITKGFIADFISDSTQIELDLKAPINNPTFTGNVIVPNADASNEAINKGQLDSVISGITITTDPTPIDGSINPVQSNGVYDALVLKEDKSNKGISNGYASLDSGGKIPISQLPNSVMEYQGLYNASTNTPILINGVGNTGDVYKVSVAGLGVNSLDFKVNDYAIYNGTTWEKSKGGADDVNSVFSRTGTVVAQNGDYNTSLVPDTLNARYQTDNQKLFNDATSSIQTQLNSKISGTGLDSQISFWNGTSTQLGDSNFTWNTTTKTLQINGTTLLGSNHSSANSNKLRQHMSATDYWLIYGDGTTTDVGIMVFELGDNGQSGVNGQRFEFRYDAVGSGIAKTPLTIDYNNITALTNTRIIGNLTIQDNPLVFENTLTPIKTEIKQSYSGSLSHLRISGNGADSGARIHLEPNDDANTGTRAKLDWMFDNFENDPTQYRIANIYTKNDYSLGTNGISVFNNKGVGDTNFGVWPVTHFGFTDDASNGVAMKMFFFDTSDTAWRTTLQGSWRTGKAVTSGDFVLASNKLYQATSTGLCGITKPSHTSGTVSDGSVNFLFVRDYSLTSSSVRPLILIGGKNDMPKFGFPTAGMQVAKDIVMWNGVFNRYLGTSDTQLYATGLSAGTNIYKILGLTNAMEIAVDDANNRIDFKKNNSTVASINNLGNITANAATTASQVVILSQLQGALIKPIRTVTATTPVLITDYTILADATSGAITLALPSASSSTGLILNIKKINNTSNNITIDPSGAELIDFDPTFSLTTWKQNVMIQSNGTGWFIIN